MNIDLADLPRWLYEEIASLHGHIDPPPAPPVLTCVGNGEPMYIYRHESGRFFARHYAGGNSDGHKHPVRTMSVGHRRQAEYCQRAGIEGGASDAILEMSTGNGTRLDLALYGEVNIGFEIQRSLLSRALAKLRTLRSFDAGWPTAWITDRARDPDWVDHVPSARLVVRDGWEDALPPRNTAEAIISKFLATRDRSRRTGWRPRRIPRKIVLDELPCLMLVGDIVPVANYAGNVVLTDKASRDVIDLCMGYPAASQWRPTAATPRRREAPQWYSRACHIEAA